MAPAVPPAAPPPGGRALLVALVLVLGAGGALVRTGLAGGGAAPPPVRALVRADTDSVRTPAEPARRRRGRRRAETPAVDTAAVAAARRDTTPPDTNRVRTYLQGLPTPLPYATLRGAPAPLLPPLGSYWRYETAIDSATGRYVLRERVGGTDVRLPVAVGFEDYREARRRQAVAATFRELLERRAQERANRQARSGLGVNIVVPGGRQSAFTTIFGKNEVALRVNGQADVKAGADYRESAQLAAITNRKSQLDPVFAQDLRLGITGTIGDKLRVDVNWDTQNQFDYQNQLKLQYTGYQDEIIQSIEAGNVILTTPSTLIRGGQSLFGIKSEFQLGALRLTTVASQQEGQANNLSLQGGAETQRFQIPAYDYDDGTHFFLSYYFRNGWEETSRTYPVTTFQQDDSGRPGVKQVTDVEVWKLTSVQPNVEEKSYRQVVAVADLGEERAVLRQRPDSAYTRRIAPNPDGAIDQYTEEEVEQFIRTRSTTQKPDDFLKAKGLTERDFQTGRFRQLRPDEYTFDPVRGYLSLTQRLNEQEALAVAFRYETQNGQNVTVGDFVTGTSAGDGASDNALFLRLLRRTNPQAPTADALPAVWPLEMRNVYYLRGGQISAADFELEVEYVPSGTAPSVTLPLDGAAGRLKLLEQLGLDRRGPGGSAGADNAFDYFPGVTIDEKRGRIIFPFLEPFGGRIAGIAASTTPSQLDRAESQGLILRSLYNQKKDQARRDPTINRYRLRGSYQGSSQSFFDLRAYAGLIRGSVRVTAGGVPLVENQDYTVDYDAGTVQITNPSLVSAGSGIDIDYEQNALFNLQKKTLLGLRADYRLDERLQLGSTLMRLTQRSPVDKFRIGDEPVSNTVWGLDGRLQLEPRWLTRAVDALPFIQTRAPSRLNVTAEFAQLRPDTPTTLAFDQARDRAGSAGGLASDELRGISYVDDFESFENTFSLKTPGAWSLASAPYCLPSVDASCDNPGPDSVRSQWRAGFGWYQLGLSLANELRGAPGAGREPTLPVDVRVVFPNRPVTSESRTLETFDLYHDPTLRGPYNYARDLAAFQRHPERTWGGLMTRLPEGYSDFDTKNVEFLEFIFKPFAEGGDAAPGAALYLDLGRISEDVVPDGELSQEDGLDLETVDPATLTGLGRRPNRSKLNGIPDVSNNRTEDLGLDGLVSYDTAPYGAIPAATEAAQFAGFIARTGALGGPEAARTALDPSADDFHHYLDGAYWDNPALFPGGATFQQRLSRYFSGQELNSFEARRTLLPAGDEAARRGNSRYPDSEDLNRNTEVDRDNAYYQYRIPLTRGELAALAAPGEDDDFVVGEVEQSGWYQIRIPVRQEAGRVAVGGIADYTNLTTVRLWTTGHTTPATIRFASFDIVGSQWQKADNLATERVRNGQNYDTGRLSVSSINTDENGQFYEPAPGTVRGIARSSAGFSSGLQRDQSIVLTVPVLAPGAQRAVYKTTLEPVDLLKYGHVRLDAHVDAREPGGRELTPERDAGRLAVFVRLGSSETTDYYEVVQPLRPFTPQETQGGENPQRATDLWQPAFNTLDVALSQLNSLRSTRDRDGRSADSLLYNVGPDGLLRAGYPDAGFAARGTRIGIRGNPSLNRMTTVVIGVRSLADTTVADPGRALENVNLWANELRVTDYDADPGWSGIANVDATLADLATVRGSFRSQTDGFGAVTSTLGERDQTAALDWTLRADLSLAKLLPSRYGWQLPVSLQLGQQTTTPRYASGRGDVRLDDLLSEIDADERLTDDERNALRTRELEAAQTFSTQRSATVSLSKTGSRSAWLRNTIEATQLQVSASESDARNPSTERNDQWRWNGSARYALPTKQPRTVRPLWFLDDVPVARLLGGLRFNYVPTTFSASATASRDFAATRQRKPLVEPVLPANRTLLPDRLQYPFREQHGFLHGRNFSLSYNPFSFLRTQFDTDVTQSLSRVGVDTLYSVVRFENGVETVTLTSREDAYAQRNDSTIFFERRVVPVSLGRTLSRAFNGDPNFRTDNYGQNFTATVTPRLPQKIGRWLVFNDVTFGAQYGWQNAPVGQAGAGARITNNVRFNTGVTLRPYDFWKGFGFFSTLDEEQRRVDREATARRQRQEQERREAAERRRSEREARERAEAEIRRLRELGELVPGDSTGTPPPGAEAPVTAPTGNLDPPNTVGAPTPVPPGGTPAVTRTGADPRTTPADTARGRSRLAGLGRTFLRRSVLAVGGITDFRVTYSLGLTSASSGFAEQGDTTASPYGFFQAAAGRGPDLAYRFGLRRRPAPADRLGAGRFQFDDDLTDNHKLSASTQLKPTPATTVSLTWDASWATNETLSILPPSSDPNDLRQTSRSSGNARSYVWAFGAGFRRLLDDQVGALLTDAAGSQPGRLVDANGDGLALSNRALTDAFTRTFSKSLGTLGGRGFALVPLPAWQVAYSGLGGLPVLRRFAQSASLRHGYSADYGTSFSSNPVGDTTGGRLQLDLTGLNLGRITQRYGLARYEASSVNVNERFAPLIGLDVTWKNQLSTNFAFNRSNVYSLTSATGNVNVRQSDELTFTLNYAKQGLNLPFFRRRLNNRLTASVTVARAITDDQSFATRQAVVAVATGASTAEEVLASSTIVNTTVNNTRLTITPTLGYQFTNAVTANFTVRYEKYDSQIATTPSFKNVNTGFNIRVNLSN